MRTTFGIVVFHSTRESPPYIIHYPARQHNRAIEPDQGRCRIRLPRSTVKLIPIRAIGIFRLKKSIYLPCRCLCLGFFELFCIHMVSRISYKLFPLSKEHNKIYQYTIVLPYNENSILSSDGLESKEEVRHVRTIEDKRLTKSLVLPK